jgi:hypothetical protein
MSFMKDSFSALRKSNNAHIALGSGCGTGSSLMKLLGTPTSPGNATTINRTHHHANTPRPELQFGLDVRRITYCVCLTLIIALWGQLATISHAQSNATDAALNGYITDANGAAVPNAQIVVRDLATNITSNAVSDATGYYRFPILKIGKYEVIVKAEGFSDVKQAGITLSVGDELRDDVQLTLGSAATTIEVRADASLLDTSSPTLEATLNSTALRALPITSRNVYNYEFFSPGVTGYPTSTFSAPAPAFDGILSSQLQLDGLDNTQRSGNNPVRLVITTPEVVDQSQIIVNGATAEYGRTAGGTATVVSRRGGDEYHGQVLAAIRPNALRAVNALITSYHPSTKWQDYDGNIGGPIIKKRLFFFANFEFNPLANPVALSITPATAAVLGIPASELGFGTASERYPTPSVRVDYKINGNNSMFGRWSSFSNEEPNQNENAYMPANTGLLFHDRMQGGEVQLVSIISPTLVNELRWGLTQRHDWTDNMQSGVTASSVITLISNVAQIGADLNDGTNVEERNIDINDDMTKSMGRHTIKFGVDYQNTLVANTNQLLVQYTFKNLTDYQNNGTSTSPAPTDCFATGHGGVNECYQTAQFQVGNPTVNNHWNSPNFYLQDEFRITKRLTVNAGLRYQTIIWPGLDQNAVLATSRTVHADHLDFAPRLSLSYQLTPSTALRAAGGLYFDTPDWNVFTNISLLNGDYIKTYNFTPNQAGAPTYPNVPTASQLLTANVPSIATYDPNYRDMYSIQSNVQLEQALGNNLSVNLSYQLLTTRRGMYSHDINLGTPLCSLADGRPAYTAAACGTGSSTTITRPNASLGQIIEISSGSNMNFNGLDLTVTKRLSHGLQFGAVYTWSKALGTMDVPNYSIIYYNTPIEDPTNLKREYGPLSSDVHHNFVFQGLYSPTFKELEWANRFQISTMTYLHSGLPINVYNGSDPSGDNVSNARPLFVSRNSLRGKNLYEEDPRISYDIPFMERFHLNLFTESENIFNHPNWNCAAGNGCTGAVNNNITSAAFLHPTSDRNARLFNFGSKITF